MTTQYKKVNVVLPHIGQFASTMSIAVGARTGDLRSAIGGHFLLTFRDALRLELHIGAQKDENNSERILTLFRGPTLSDEALSELEPSAYIFAKLLPAPGEFLNRFVGFNSVCLLSPNRQSEPRPSS
jgi:hypothetical protein